MSLTDSQMNELIYALQGTCQSLTEALEKRGLTEDDMSRANYDHMDQEIFLCEMCHWWYEINEMSQDHEWICNDCED